MKIKLLPVAGLLISAFTSYGQVSENFNKATLSSGSLACWQSDYTSQTFTTARVAAPTNLTSDSRLTLNTTTPISASASLKFTESLTVPILKGMTSTETIITPALGADGNTVSFKVRLNAGSVVSGSQLLYAIVICGSSEEYYALTSSDIGNTVTINSTIAGSGGGGNIKIALWYSNYTYFNTPTTLSYSLDIDDFTTSAIVDPANNCMTALPVTLSSFSAYKTENVVKLNWLTTQETNSDRFEINRSADAKEWVMIGKELSSGENIGQLAYQFTDVAPLSGTSYYRLKMIDKDGSYAYSSIRSVDGSKPGITVAYPNPVADRLFLKGNDGNDLSAKELHQISVFDMKGVEISRLAGQAFDSNAGLDVKALPTGFYVLKIRRIDGADSAHKIMIRK